MLRQLEKIRKRIEKSKADVMFLTTCIMYNLTRTPNMTRFKLHKKSAAKTALAQRFRTNLLRTEIKLSYLLTPTYSLLATCPLHLLRY